MRLAQFISILAAAHLLWSAGIGAPLMRMLDPTNQSPIERALGSLSTQTLNAHVVDQARRLDAPVGIRTNMPQRLPELSVSRDVLVLPEFRIEAPSATNRVTAGMAVQPVSTTPGSRVTVVVKVRTAPGHWIYALENSGSRNLPTTLDLKCPPVLRTAGPWRGPEPKVKDDGSRVYSTEVLFQRRFLVEPSAVDATLKLPLALSFQVCNEALCWPPETINLKSELKIRSSR